MDMDIDICMCMLVSLYINQCRYCVLHYYGHVDCIYIYIYITEGNPGTVQACIGNGQQNPLVQVAP